MTISKIRTTAAVAASSLAIVALAACGGGGSVTKGESSSKADETTSAAPTTAETTEPAEQSSEASPSDEESEKPSDDSSDQAADVTIVPATQKDVEPARRFIIDFYTQVVNGHADQSCKQMYSESMGGVLSGSMLDECARTLEDSMKGTDESALRNGSKTIKGKLTSDGMVELTNPASDQKIYVVKGSDGKYYFDLDKLAG